MSRTFAYARVSTFDQTPENQIREIKAAGFAVEQHRIITETISGSMAIAQREGFSKLLDRMEKGDVLIVTKLDRLGRDAIDVSTTVAQFERDLLIERTQSGLARAKAEGKILGRPSALSGGQQIEVKEKIKNGEAISAIARHFETSRQTIMRVRDQA